MIIIDKDNIEAYRYAVGKICFLRMYKDYRLVEDYPNTNCFKLIDTKTEEKAVIALFSFVNSKEYPQERLIIAYQKNPRESMRERISDYFVLSKEFNELFREKIVDALISPKKIVEEFTDDEKLFFSTLILDIKKYPEIEEKCYKYLAEETGINNYHSVNDGNIGFANPSEFNDPFDCNCVFHNRTSLSDLFRVFCVAPTNDNILMWSYYSTNHKGFCMEYEKKDIIDSIDKSMIDGLCIVGQVDYKDKRPKQIARNNNINYSEILFYINAAFTKFSEWKHEREYRYVLISNSFSSASPYVTFNVPLIQVFGGCKGTTTSVQTTNPGVVLNVHKMVKHPTEYRLKQ